MQWTFRVYRSRTPPNLQTLIYLSFVFAILGAPQTTATADAVSVATEIRNEAIRPNQSPEGRPLPLVSHWTTGKHPLSEGWAPVHQIKSIEQGHYLLPWFEFPDPKNYGPTKKGMTEFREYYEAPLKRARDLKLPLVLVSSQWERFLSQDPYLNLPPSENPNVVTSSGKILPKVSPFGPLEPWEYLGRSLTSNPWFRLLQEWYPDPPLVVFLSNNEAQKLRWRDVERSARYVASHGLAKNDDYKREVVGEGWITHYRALQAGMRDGLANESWKANAIFVGYQAFGQANIGRWSGWKKYSLATTGRVDPGPSMWDGGGPSYYTHNWNPTTDFKVWSPQIEFMNLVFQLKHAYRANPEFWLEMSVWDGYMPTDPKTDKRKYYARLGQTFSPQRYAGFTMFGMWLLRPRVIREFRGWRAPWKDNEPYFMAIIGAVDQIHTNPVLREWWRTGELVPNRARQHHYQVDVPPEYLAEDRWFLLDADVNPAFPWSPWRLSMEIPVFSLALRKGETPKRQWLVYGHSPLGDRQNVQLTIPEYGDIRVDIAIGGTYYLIDEETGKIQQLR